MLRALQEASRALELNPGTSDNLLCAANCLHQADLMERAEREEQGLIREWGNREYRVERKESRPKRADHREVPSVCVSMV